MISLSNLYFSAGTKNSTSENSTASILRMYHHSCPIMRSGELNLSVSSTIRDKSSILLKTPQMIFLWGILPWLGGVRSWTWNREKRHLRTKPRQFQWWIEMDVWSIWFARVNIKQSFAGKGLGCTCTVLISCALFLTLLCSCLVVITYHFRHHQYLDSLSNCLHFLCYTT
jgi:hypothetical protein